MKDEESYQPSERRPIATRELRWTQAIAAWLTARGASPNLISTLSSVFATCGGVAIVATREADPTSARWLWIAAALCVQLRLLANLFDGMVALSSGKASRLGELFNEIPDRISDAVLLAALGFAPGSSPHLGYVAAMSAVFVAYVRAMGAVAGAGQIFAGVMAKPQRMFVVTMLCVVQAVAPSGWLSGDLALGLGATGWTLALIIAGCAATSWTRLSVISTKLQGRPHA